MNEIIDNKISTNLIIKPIHFSRYTQNPNFKLYKNHENLYKYSFNEYKTTIFDIGFTPYNLSSLQYDPVY